MNRRPVVAVILAVVCAAGVMSQSCEPDCSGKQPFDKVPDPQNCSNYYYCGQDELPSDAPVGCGQGNNFDTILMECVPENDAHCDKSCLENTCHLYCNGNLDFTTDPKNCSRYYICLAGGVVVGPCGCPIDQPIFDGTNCIKDPNKCCNSDDLCIPVCEPGTIQAPDPLDCHKFYICVEGVIDEAYHNKCPEGKYYNYNAGHCVLETEPCTNLCKEDRASAGGESVYPDECNTMGLGSTTPTGGGNTPTGSSSTLSGGKATPTTKVPVDPSTTSDCVMSMTCPGVGFYPMCHTCQPYYYECTEDDVLGTLMQCNNNEVFNPVPQYPVCISPSNCPYSP